MRITVCGLECEATTEHIWTSPNGVYKKYAHTLAHGNAVLAREFEVSNPNTLDFVARHKDEIAAKLAELAK